MFGSRVCAALCVLLVLCAGSSAAVTFHLTPGGTRCFTEELGTLHRVQMYYKMAKSHAAFVSVSITSPEKTVVFQQKTAEKEYHHWFHPITAGEYAVCFNSVERAGKSVPDFSVVFSLLPEYEVESQKPLDHKADHAKDNEHNRPLMNQARYIENNLDALHNEYRYLKERETQMRDTNESTNSRTVWVSLITLAFLAAVRGLHHVTLRRYLKAKKILE